MKYILNITLGMGMLWLSAGYAKAQQVELLKPKDLGRWNIPPGELQWDNADRRRALCRGERQGGARRILCVPYPAG